MSKIIAEEITMGFRYPEPVSTYYGYFDSFSDATQWAKNNFKGFECIEDCGEVFFQKDLGASVKEVYFHDSEDEDFLRSIEMSKMLNREYFSEDKMKFIN